MQFHCLSKFQLIFISLVVYEVKTQGLPRCGDVFTEKNGIISYKQSDIIVPNERCIWIIGVPSAVSYNINITHLGFRAHPRGQILLITGVVPRIVGTPPMTTYYPRGVGSIGVNNAQLIIVTFYTTSTSITGDSTGFVLHYDATTAPYRSGVSSPLSSHHISEPGTFGFSYPPTRHVTRNNELAAFAFPPSHNIRDECSKRVTFNLGNLRQGCNNPIFVYDLRIDLSPTTHPWIASNRLCENATFVHHYNDTALAILSTDYYSAGTRIGYSVQGC